MGKNPLWGGGSPSPTSWLPDLVSPDDDDDDDDESSPALLAAQTEQSSGANDIHMLEDTFGNGNRAESDSDVETGQS